ncbi:MAG: D-alanyl-D-alanine carboxypeptidase/D-alanyl-D-alanine-endopeptidase [Bacteroidota bacterium]|nr:D-alanyl-D-alanine carboxypeptidase/D-alanyl-D-alanine-endopeptidase [Bacteroidota bacterium]
MKKYILLLIALIFSINLFSQTSVLQKKIQDFLNEPTMKNALLSFYLADSGSGQKIWSTEPQVSMVPASVLKVVTTATALEVFGPDYRFHTLVCYNGKIDYQTHTLKGNVIIKGGGDPALGSHFFKDHYDGFISSWVKALKSQGIKHISGTILADASIYDDQPIPTTWIWEDLGNYYGAGATGLSIFDNMYTVHFKSPLAPNQPTTITSIEPEIPGLSIRNMVQSAQDNSDNAYVFGGPGQFQREVRGTIPCNRADFSIKASIPNPPLFTAQFLAKTLRKAGISVENAPRMIQSSDTLKQKLTVVVETKSPPLKDIITLTNTYSINLFAEHLLKHIGMKYYGEGSTDAGAKAMLDFWSKHGVDTRGMFIVDGCGLSRFNAISAEQITRVLQYMYSHSKYSDIFYSCLPDNNEGTMRSLFSGKTVKGQFRAKSGTMTRAKCYAGYYKGSNKNYSFCVMLNNFSDTSKQVTNKIASLLETLDY